MDVIRNFESEFAINQKVIIQNGFYKDNHGIVHGYDQKTSEYLIKIKLNNLEKLIGCKLTDIRLEKQMLWRKY